MTDRSTFEARLEVRLIARAAAATRPFNAAAITRSAALTGRRGRLPGLGRWAPLDTRYAHALVLLLLAALLLAIGAAVLIGTSLRRHPQPLPGLVYPTGAMTTRRSDSQVALLNDGRVLVAGGVFDDPGPDPLSAQIYDPSTNAFGSTGTMRQIRSRATATTLTDGRVLIAGGIFGDQGGTVAMSTAELYDPSTGTFRTTGSMYQARYQSTAIRLADGRVLVIGGFSDGPNGSAIGLPAAEIFDPATGSWSAPGAMPWTQFTNTDPAQAGSGRPAVALLVDGRVLVAGGWSSAGALASALLFDPATNSFSETGTMNAARADATATVLANGQVLVVAGNGATPGATS
ncbi:MAG: Kelch repeat-containing protein, partial [Candidatus Limnocylindrales bacterium]